MLQSVADRLMQTLSIRHVAFFIADGAERAGGGRGSRRAALAAAHVDGFERAPAATRRIARSELSRLAAERRPTSSSSAPGIIWTRSRGSWPHSVRQTIADLDLNYYLPCTVRGRTIAFLGVSRTETGEFLSSDDVELLLTLANYVGIAIENANLYRSLKQKVGRVRAAEGIQRKHRRIDQRRHSGGRSGRPGGKLEHADGAAERHRPRGCGGPHACGTVSRRAGGTVRAHARRDAHPSSG